MNQSLGVPDRRTSSALFRSVIEAEEISAAEGTEFSPQRLCGPIERRCYQTSFNLTIDPKRDPLEPGYVG